MKVSIKQVECVHNQDGLNIKFTLNDMAMFIDVDKDGDIVGAGTDSTENELACAVICLLLGFEVKEN
jgi:hypothetical protein